MNVGQNIGQPLLKCFKVGRVSAPVDFDMDDRFDNALAFIAGRGNVQQIAFGIAPIAHQRVNDQVNRQALTVHLHGDRIDQEG